MESQVVAQLTRIRIKAAKRPFIWDKERATITKVHKKKDGVMLSYVTLHNSPGITKHKKSRTSRLFNTKEKDKQ